jgi:hypothetical protein
MSSNVNSIWGADDAPVFIVLGQSNSYGHNTLLEEDEQINTPGLNNVFTLSESDTYSISFPSVTWRGLTTLGDANIGTPKGSSLGNQNNPVNAANRFAALWQNHITSGNDLSLPDLYVILMGWGSQGMYQGATDNNRWSPDRNESDVESLYPRTLRTLRMAMDSLRCIGKNPRIISIQWNQWESEALSTPAAMASAMNFNRIISGINDALGSSDTPWHFFYPLSRVYDSERTEKVIQSLESVVAAEPTLRSFIDPRNAPHYTGIAPDFGIFGSDNVHYNAQTHRWFAQLEWNKIASGYKGIPLATVPYRMDQYWLNKVVQGSCNFSTEWCPNHFSSGIWLDTCKAQSGLKFFDSLGVTNAWSVTEEQGKKTFKTIALSGNYPGNCMAVATASAMDGKYGYFEIDLFSSPCPEITICVRVQASSETTFCGIGYGYIAIQLSGAYIGKLQYMPNNISQGKNQSEATPYLMVWNLSAPLNIRSINFNAIPSDGIYKNVPTFSTGNNSGANLISGWPTNTWNRWRVGLFPENSGTVSAEWYDIVESKWIVAVKQNNMNSVLNTYSTSTGQFSILSGMSSQAGNLEQQNINYNQLFKDISFKSLD